MLVSIETTDIIDVLVANCRNVQGLVAILEMFPWETLLP